MKVKKVKRKMLIEATEKKSENEIKVLIIRMSSRNEMNQIWKNIYIIFLFKTTDMVVVFRNISKVKTSLLDDTDNFLPS